MFSITVRVFSVEEVDESLGDETNSVTVPQGTLLKAISDQNAELDEGAGNESTVISLFTTYAIICSLEQGCRKLDMIRV